MKKTIKQTAKAVYGTVGVLEGLVTAIRCFGASAADVVSIVCTLFGIVLPMPVAIAVRSIILATSGYCFIDSLKAIAPRLYRKIKEKEGVIVYD